MREFYNRVNNAHTSSAMRKLYPVLLLFSTLCCSSTRATDTAMVLLSSSGGAASSNARLRFVAKSTDVVVRAGDTVTLACRTGAPWQLCSWKKPDGDWCDRLSSDKYATACPQSPRVRYQRGLIRNDSRLDPTTDCSVTIVDLGPEDSGQWGCLARASVRDAQGAEESVQLTVAAPYTLALAPSNPVVRLLAGSNPVASNGAHAANAANVSQTAGDDEVVCVARGGGAVDPELQWLVDGKPAEDGTTKTWKETHSDGAQLVYLALSLRPSSSSDISAPSFDAASDGANLRCMSRQLFPNGTAIFESTIATTLSVVIDTPLAEEHTESTSPGTSNVAGIVFTVLIVVIAMAAAALICYAQKTKRWCYAKRVVVVDVPDPPPPGEGGRGRGRDDHDSDDAETVRLTIDTDTTLTPQIQTAAASTANQANGQVPRQQEGEPRHFDIVSFRVCREADHDPERQQPDHRQDQHPDHERPGTVDDDDDRDRQVRPEHLELLATAATTASSLPSPESPTSPTSPSPTTAARTISPPSPKPPSAPPMESPMSSFNFGYDESRLQELITASPGSMEDVGSKQSLTEAIASTIAASGRTRRLSDNLTTPRKANVRRNNDYVKLKPRPASSAVISDANEDNDDDDIDRADGTAANREERVLQGSLEGLAYADDGPLAARSSYYSSGGSLALPPEPPQRVVSITVHNTMDTDQNSDHASAATQTDHSNRASISSNNASSSQLPSSPTANAPSSPPGHSPSTPTRGSRPSSTRHSVSSQLGTAPLSPNEGAGQAGLQRKVSATRQETAL